MEQIHCGKNSWRAGCHQRQQSRYLDYISRGNLEPSEQTDDTGAQTEEDPCIQYQCMLNECVAASSSTAKTEGKDFLPEDSVSLGSINFLGRGPVALAEVGRLAEDVRDLTDDRVGVAGLGEVSVVVVAPEDDTPSEGLDHVLGHFALFRGLHCDNGN